MRTRTVAAGIALVIAGLLSPWGIEKLFATSCVPIGNGTFATFSCGDPGTPPAKGVGLLHEAPGSPFAAPAGEILDVKLADVNADGALDAVVSIAGNPHQVAVLLGDGHGGFGAPVSYFVNVNSFIVNVKGRQPHPRMASKARHGRHHRRPVCG